MAWSSFERNNGGATMSLSGVIFTMRCCALKKFMVHGGGKLILILIFLFLLFFNGFDLYVEGSSLIYIIF